MLALGAHQLERLRPGAVLAFLAIELGDLQLQLAQMAVKTPLPARRILPDDGRVGEQPLPAPRRAKRACHDRPLAGVGLRFEGLLVFRIPAPGSRIPSGEGAPQRLVVRSRPSAFVTTSADKSLGLRAIELRDLAEREILRETRRGEMLRAAREQREERAARRMGAPRATVEPGRDLRPPQRVLEQAEVALWRTDEDGHLVETNPAARFGQDAARNLDALATFARRRKELQRAVGRALRRLMLGLEQKPPQRREIVRAMLVGALDGRAHQRETRARLAIGARHRGKDRVRAICQRRHQCGLRGVVDGDIEQEHGAAHGAIAEQARRGVQQVGAIGGRDIGKRLVEAGEEVGQVRACRPSAAHGIGRDAGEPQLLQRPRQRTREAGQAGDGAEIAQRAVARRGEDGPRSDGLRAETAARRPAVRRERDHRGPGRELREAQAREAERGAALGGQRPREVIGRAARGADDGDRMMRGKLPDEG